MISMDDYMEFQKEMQALNGMYEIPVGEKNRVTFGKTAQPPPHSCNCGYN